MDRLQLFYPATPILGLFRMQQIGGLTADERRSAGSTGKNSTCACSNLRRLHLAREHFECPC
jgi:hypothetical protein